MNPSQRFLLTGLIIAATFVIVTGVAFAAAPVAVPFSSGPAFPLDRKNGNDPDPQYAAPKAIDGDPATFACLLDDTLEGNDAGTIPARAATPVTGHIIFDLGENKIVTGARLIGRRDAGGMNPKDVDFFYFADNDPSNNPVADDIENDADVQGLLLNHVYKSLSPGGAETVTWNGVVARYIGLRVNDSYESGGTHFNFQIGEMEFLAVKAPSALKPGSRVPPFYVKRDTLPETLLATRARFATWFPPSSSDQPAESASPELATGLWEQLGRDFPAASNPLLRYVPFEWFGDNGWFANADNADLERQLIRRAIDEAGRAGTILQTQFDELRRADPPPDDPRWLDLCVKASEFALAMRQVQNGRAAVGHLKAQFPETYPADSFLQSLDKIAHRLEEKLSGAWPSGDRETAELLGRFDRVKYEALVRQNPLLAPGKILFVKRFTYQTGWYYSEFMQAGPVGGNLCVLDLAGGKVTELCPQLDGGIFDRFDLSFDGNRVAFGYRPEPSKAFRLWEVNIDGTGLRQITVDPPCEARRLASYGLDPTRNELGPWRGHTDDFHPCYLPDGGLCFASSRCERGVLCDAADNLSVNVLYRIDADGGNLRPLSQGALSESTPSVTGDGRILYTRWEYVEKGVIAVQSLWTMRPDGSGSTEVFGNEHEFPPVLIHGRALPGRSDRFVATCTMHHPFAVGPIMLIDTGRDIRTLAPLSNLTPDTHVSIEGVGAFPQGEAYIHRKNGRWVRDNTGPLFCEPWPLSDEFFLVTCNPDRPHNHPTAYGLWLIDTFGNRVKIYDDPAISCWQPVPLRPRPCPPVLPPVEAIADDQAASTAFEATLLLADVYRGLEGVKRGEVKYLRIFEQVPRPWTAKRFWPDDIAFGQNAPISRDAHIFVKILHGVVPVEPDGSAHFVVPADRNVFFQALDENYLEIQRMRTFVNLRPGEVRGCIGCHEPRSEAPPARMPAAWLRLADRPVVQPGDETIPRPLYYPTDIQPILDRHCVRCHGGEKTEAELDLSGEMTTYFNRSYENLMDKHLVRYIQEFVGPQPRAQKTNVTPLPPRALGSHASRLVAVLREGHHDVKLSREEFVRLTTWVDANVPYYGSYFGRRNLKYRGLPDFRPEPTLQSARGLPDQPPGQ